MKPTEFLSRVANGTYAEGEIQVIRLQDKSAGNQVLSSLHLTTMVT